jgi:hypothetical protein
VEGPFGNPDLSAAALARSAKAIAINDQYALAGIREYLRGTGSFDTYVLAEVDMVNFQIGLINGVIPIPQDILDQLTGIRSDLRGADTTLNGI